jgi:hypothetical protein
MDCRAHRDRKCASNAKNLRAKTTTTAHRAPMLAPHRQSETESGAPTRTRTADPLITNQKTPHFQAPDLVTNSEIIKSNPLLYINFAHSLTDS